jgi:hypothetical protein
MKSRVAVAVSIPSHARFAFALSELQRPLLFLAAASVVLGLLIGAVTFPPGVFSKEPLMDLHVPEMPSEPELAIRAHRDLIPPRMLSQASTLNLNDPVPCPFVVLSKVLVNEQGLAIGVKLDESREEYAKCENTVIAHLLRSRFIPAQRNGHPVVTWFDVPVHVNSREVTVSARR